MSQVDFYYKFSFLCVIFLMLTDTKRLVTQMTYFIFIVMVLIALLSQFY